MILGFLVISAQKYDKKINLRISVSPMLFSTTEKRYDQCFVPAVSVLVYDFWNTAVAFAMKMLTLNNSKSHAYCPTTLS